LHEVVEEHGDDDGQEREVMKPKRLKLPLGGVMKPKRLKVCARLRLISTKLPIVKDLIEID